MRKIIELCLSLAFGFAGFWALTLQAADFSPRNFGLGKNTHSFTNRFEDLQISGFANDLAILKKNQSKLQEQGNKTVLWVGASQLHAINRPQKGDQLAVTFANQDASKKNRARRYIQLSEPNANYHELWAIISAFLDETPPDAIVLALTYDDLKELGIRDSRFAPKRLSLSAH